MKRLILIFGMVALSTFGQTYNSANLSNIHNVRYANEGSTGTALNKLAKLTGAPSTAIIAATTDVSGIAGIVVAGAGITGNADIAFSGKTLCVFDGATVAGHYVIISGTTAGECSDSGADTPPTTSQNIGRVLTTNGGAGTYEIDLFAPGDWLPPIPGPPGAPGADGAAGVPGYSPNSLISGGYVVWIANYDFRVSASSYYIGGTQYNSPQTNVTLDAADANPRFDAIVVDSASAVVVIKGTAAVNPEKPTVDPATQLDLTFVYVPSGSTQPPNVTSTLMYNEDTGPASEWTATASGAGFNLASTNNPFVGTKDIEATTVATGNYMSLAAAAPLNLSTVSNLVFYIRSKAAWPSNNRRSLQFYFSDAGGVRIGSIVSLNNGQFGFTSSQTTAYQQIVIPLALFATTSAVTNLRITVAGSGTTLGFYLDYISLQAGIQAPTTPAGLTWKGAWNTSATYAVNDVVIRNGVSYVALQSNTNSTPPSANWAAMSSTPLTLRAFGASFDGGGAALTAGKTVYTTFPNFACTVNAWNITVDTGTVTVDIWRLAAGTAIPVAGNSITGTGAGRPAIAANTAIQSTNLTGWSSIAMAAHDVLAFNLQAVASATFVNLVVECLQ